MAASPLRAHRLASWRGVLGVDRAADLAGAAQPAVDEGQAGPEVKDQLARCATAGT
jgi:hypothetical protein